MDKKAQVKKAQIRMGETIAVLIIFFFLLVFGAIFYANIQRSKIISSNEEVYQQESIRVSQMVSYFPELQCSADNIIDDNCYDKYKLDSAESHINSNVNFYFPFFLYTEIVIDEIYPETNHWVVYNYSLNRSQPMYTYIPISLYEPIEKKYSFGVLSISYYPYYG